MSQLLIAGETTPSRWAWLTKLMITRLFYIVLTVQLFVCSGIWIAFVLITNHYMGRAYNDGWWLIITNTVLCSPFVSMLTLMYLKSRWTKHAALTTDDISSLVVYGKKVVNHFGKTVAWDDILTVLNPTKRQSTLDQMLGAGREPVFPKRITETDIIGGILCAIYIEGGWRAFPPEAWTFFANHPGAFRAFYSNYR